MLDVSGHFKRLRDTLCEAVGAMRADLEAKLVYNTTNGPISFYASWADFRSN